MPRKQRARRESCLPSNALNQCGKMLTLTHSNMLGLIVGSRYVVVEDTCRGMDPFNGYGENSLDPVFPNGCTDSDSTVGTSNLICQCKPSRCALLSDGRSFAWLVTRGFLSVRRTTFLVRL